MKSIRTYNELNKIMFSYGYKFYEEPYKLNIVGLRKVLHTNAFDDDIYVAFKDEKDTNYFQAWPITTDPGFSSLMNPQKRKGTAILVEDQYLDTFAIDYHRGNYQAICQRLAEVKVYRDNGKDKKHDLDPDTIDTGFFGINIHKAGILSKLVDGWSAGCQVFAKESDFNVFMTLCKTHSKRHGNKFTYTLLRGDL
jgi:hypothetical protein